MVLNEARKKSAEPKKIVLTYSKKKAVAIWCMFTMSCLLRLVAVIEKIKDNLLDEPGVEFGTPYEVRPLT